MTFELRQALVALKSLYNSIGRLERSALVAALSSAMATVLSSTGLMSLSAYLISFAALQPSIADIMVAVTAVRFFGIARAVFRYTERMVSHRAVFKMLSRLRTYVYESAAALKGIDLLKLEASERFATLSSDIEVLQDFYLRTFLPLGTSIGLCVLYGIVITFVHPMAGLTYTVLFLLATLGVSAFVYRRTQGLTAAFTTQTRHYKTALNAFGEGYIDLLTNGRVDAYQEALHAQEVELQRTEQAIFHWRFIGSFAQQLILHLAVIASALLAIDSVLHKHLDGVLLATCILAVFTLFETAPNLLTLFQKLEAAGKSAQRILSYRRGQEVPSQMAAPADTAVSLGFKGVSAGYTEGNLVLHDLHLSLAKGEKIAIVGESGSGKSTIGKLLTGLLDPQTGTVTTTPDRLAVVDQHVYLFNKTLRDNLLLGDTAATDGQLLAALKAAAFELAPEALDALIGLGGHTYSGGERQRIALARALLKEADTLLLDEATAGLDHNTEDRLLSTLFQHLEKTGMGLLWITHRLIHMDRLDRIYVLQNGAIVEQGTHETLIKKDGLYASMVALQEDKQLTGRL